MTPNETLYQQLLDGTPPEVRWSPHAKQRARELVHQCVPIKHIQQAVESPQQVYWSPRYERPLTRYGDVSIAYNADEDGTAVVDTVLPGTAAVWERVHATGLVSDREYRREAFG